MKPSEIAELTDPQQLDFFARDGSKKVRLAVAENPNIPMSAIKLLVRDTDSIVRSSVWQTVEEKITDEQMLSALSSDEDWKLRSWAAGNPNTGSGLLSNLANDDEQMVRKCVAKNPAASPDLLFFLARDVKWPVRLAVAANPHTPSDAISNLKNDVEADVRKAAQQASERPPSSVLIPIKVVVTAKNSNGNTDFYPVIIKCTQEQYDAGDHYREAELSAEEAGYDAGIPFDENDPAGQIVMGCFKWETVSVIDLAQPKSPAVTAGRKI